MNDRLLVDKASARKTLYSFDMECEEMLRSLKNTNDLMYLLDDKLIGASKECLYRFSELQDRFKRTTVQINTLLQSYRSLCEEAAVQANNQELLEEKSNNDRQIDVFISYSSKEYTIATQVLTSFNAKNITCWMAPDSIPAGSDYSTEIQDVLESCRVFVLLLSEKSQKSKWVVKELDQALSMDKIIIPFHLDDSTLAKAFILRLTNIQRIEASGQFGESMQTMIQRIQALLKTS